MKKSTTLLVLAVVVIFSIAAYAIWLNDQNRIDRLIIAVQPTQNPVEIKELSRDLADFLSRRIGLPVEIYVPTDYTGVIEGLRFKTVHLALMGSWPAYLAVQRSGSELMLVEVRTVAVGDRVINATNYYSYWIVLKDSAYKSLEELRGKKVCFPSRVSSSGYLAPMAKLVELGLIEKRGASVDPEDFFGKGNVVFGGGYGQCWEALRARQVDVTVMAGDVSYSLYTQAMSASKVLESQGPLPSHGVVVIKDLPNDLKQRVKQAFLELSGPEHQYLMRRFVSSLFVGFEAKSAEEHFSALQKYITLTGFEFT
ncbi:MAG: phosphate/phosphite/phosphonate ABC transporter substrate-binding protein [Aigarchaeota archaeon]|nr:phosphate/phosphite/phosphonate ABC transporter substrate-binding protein [Aigarchaeota archaeon]MDW8093222.1 phosphate/phosphite/phosphonate ABC transporter substrate-binding protein [Nitrososphaerota archaeon]